MIAGSEGVSSRAPPARFTCKRHVFRLGARPLRCVGNAGSSTALAQAHELTLAGLKDGPIEAPRVELELAERLAVELDAPLVDHPAPVTRGLAEVALEQLGQEQDAVDLDLGQVVRRF